jgi:peptidoglycan biosynthesis protein MviN/MurJ (putative lipid II flippase)
MTYFTFAKKNQNMEKSRQFSQKHFIYFAISTIAMIALYFIAPQWIWVPIPFVCTYFVQMFDWL